MNLSKNIREDKVNFVCPRCQKIYYQADHDDFNKDQRGVTKDARRYKSHYHSCKGTKGRKVKRGGKR